MSNQCADSEEHIIVHPNKYELIIHDAPPMATPPAPVTDIPLADTLGWDTVFAINLPHVNQALKTKGSTPGDFSQALGTNYKISGTFDDWQVTMGGDGQDIYLLVPIKSGSLEFQGTSYDMATGEATVMINFDFLPGVPKTPPTPTTKKGNAHNLQSKDTTTDPTNEPIASVIQFVFPKNSTASGNTQVARALFQSAMTEWFINNLSRFQHVFSTVNLAQKADKASFQWLKPSLTSYAYADGTKPENSILGVLTTTDQRSIANLSHEITPFAIPKGSQSGFLISSQLFLKKSVLPGLPLAFKNVPPGAFILANNGNRVELDKGKQVDVKDIKYGGSTYHPKLIGLNLQVNDTEIVTDMTITVNISPGIDVTIYQTTYQTLTLVNKPDGTQTLGYKNTRPPKQNYTKHVATWVKITTGIAALIVAIVGAVVAGPEADIIEMIIIGIIVAIIIGIIEGIELIIEDVIADGVANAMPSINPMIYAATNPIVWPTAQSKFTLTHVGVNGSIQLGGSLSFPT